MLAWDPAYLVVTALRTIGPNATAQQVKDHLSNQTHLAGINGIYDFKAVPQRGLTAHNALVSLWNPSADVWKVVSEPTGIPVKKH